MDPKGYTTEADIEKYMLKDIDASYSSVINGWIAGVEQFIDQKTGHNFKADSAATARTYDGDGTDTMLIDECVEVTKVEIGNDTYGSSFTEVPASGAGRYFLYPENYAAKKYPINEVQLSAGIFGCGRQNQRITAKWGYSATPPAAIKFVATVLVAGIINSQEILGKSGAVTKERIGNYDVAYGNADSGPGSVADFKQAMQILDTFARLQI